MSIEFRMVNGDSYVTEKWASAEEWLSVLADGFRKLTNDLPGRTWVGMGIDAGGGPFVSLDHIASVSELPR